jgi:hypothetical protein
LQQQQKQNNINNNNCPFFFQILQAPLFDMLRTIFTKFFFIYIILLNFFLFFY